MWQLLPLCIVLLTWEIANCMSEVSVSNLVRMLITGCPIINSTDCNVITIIFVSIYNWSFLNTKQIIIQILRRMKYNFFRRHYTLLYRNRKREQNARAVFCFELGESSINICSLWSMWSADHWSWGGEWQSTFCSLPNRWSLVGERLPIDILSTNNQHFAVRSPSELWILYSVTYSLFCILWRTVYFVFCDVQFILYSVSVQFILYSATYSLFCIVWRTVYFVFCDIEFILYCVT